MSIHGVEKIAVLNASEREEIFSEAAAQKGMVPAAIEKDFWVCWVSHRIFVDEALSRQVLFKGGTSLSKCYGLIERFSEDIDLILDWDLLTDEDPYRERSNTQQDRFNKQMSAKGEAYIAKTVLPQMQKIFEGFTLRIKPYAPKSIFLEYPKSFEAQYIKPQVELEIGPLSAMTPNDNCVILPYCADVAKNLADNFGISVRAIKAKKPFGIKLRFYIVRHIGQKKSNSLYDTHGIIMMYFRCWIPRSQQKQWLIVSY